MKNIILVGMPGCGKSTLGVILAKELGLDFIDTDIVIQNMTGELLQTTLEREGVTGLLDREQQAIVSLDFSENGRKSVVSTGGSAVLREESVKHLKRNGVCVYIKLELSEIEKRINNRSTRGIAAGKDETLADIYAYRTPFYENCADVVVDCDGQDVSTNVERIKNILIQEKLI